MTDTGPTTTTIDQEAPIQRERDEVLQARREVTISAGALSPVNLAQMLEVGQAMAKAGPAIPQHLRGSPGACLAIIEYAHRWGLMAYGVANKSYVAKDRLCFESQLVHAVIELQAPLHRDSLNFSFDGEGAKRKCKVWAQCRIRGEVKTLTWESPEFGKIHPKNSPLWETKPDLQLFYNTSRDWARVFFPHILLGALTEDEAAGIENDETRATKAKDVTPVTRFAGNGGSGEGFRPDNIERGLSGSPMGSADELANLATEADARRLAQAATEPAGEGSSESTEGAGGSKRKPRTKRATTEQQDPVASTNASTVSPGTPPSEAAPGGSTPKTVRPDDQTGAEQKEGPDGGRQPEPAPPEDEVVQQPSEPHPPAEATPAVVDVTTLKTPETYIEYAKGWIRTCTTVPEIMARWKAEGVDRGRCMVTGDHFDELKVFRNACIAAIEEGR